MKSKHHFLVLTVLSALVGGCANFAPEFACDPECDEDYVCVNKTCIEKARFFPCETNDNCYSGTSCVHNVCLCVTENSGNQYCASDQVCCIQTGCVDLKSNDDNCGSCGFSCNTGYSCLEKKCRPNTQCTNGVKKCNESQTGVDICMSGKWVKTDIVCLDNEVCRDNVCVPETCESPSFRCKNGNVEYCLNNMYSTYEECTPPDICDEENHTCVTPPECDNDEMGCTDDGNIRKCIDEHWIQVQKCPAEKTCNKTSFTCVGSAVCSANDKECDGTSVKTCVNGQWSISPCPTGNICKNGNCIERACEDNETVCATNAVTSAIEVKTCFNGEYTTTDTCMSGYTCAVSPDTHIASCKEETCAKTYVCQGQTLYKCSQGDMSIYKTCQDYETCDESVPDCLPNCGNGRLDANEECDSDTLISPDHSCAATFGSDYSGTVTCTTDCKANTTGCSKTVVNPDDLDWDFEQSFNSLTTTDHYDSSYTPTANGVTWNINAAIKTIADYSLDGSQYAVFVSTKTSVNHITASGISKGIGTFYFDYRGWNTDTGSFKVIVVKGGTETEETIDFDGSKLAFRKDYQDSAITEIRIEIVPQNTTKNKGRLCIDNVRWTNAK